MSHSKPIWQHTMVQLPEPQSAPALQALPGMQGSQSLPPQSTSDSSPSCMPLMQRAQGRGSQPLAGFMSQSTNPGRQPPTAHIPALQLNPVFAGPMHTLPQPPQLLTLVR